MSIESNITQILEELNSVHQTIDIISDRIITIYILVIIILSILGLMCLCGRNETNLNITERVNPIYAHNDNRV